MNMYDLAIIGAGPAGLSAAIYTARAQLKTVIFGDQTKSNLYKAHVVSNYFGFLNHPSGAELTELGLKQAISFGAEQLTNQIVDINVNSDQSFTLKDNFQNLYQAKSIIIATGQSYVLSGIRGEQEYLGKGVSYCVNCDGFFFKSKPVVVIGSSDYAAEEALQLLNYTKDITILSHGKDFTINQDIQKELTLHQIKTIKTPRLSEIKGEQKVEKIIDLNHQEYQTSGIFLAVGVAGANAFAQKLGLEMNGNYLKTDANGLTNLPGVFAAGDCTGSPAQVASSVGNGCNAALSAIKFIRGVQNYIQYN